MLICCVVEVEGIDFINFMVIVVLVYVCDVLVDCWFFVFIDVVWIEFFVVLDWFVLYKFWLEKLFVVWFIFDIEG